MQKPAQGSGKSQITPRGETTSRRFAADPNLKVKGSDQVNETPAITPKNA
jgi:hypothetical protein